MTFGVCYFFFTFFNSWARDLWPDKCLELFFFSNGDNLNTPHRQRELFSLSFYLPPVRSVRLCLLRRSSFLVCFNLSFTLLSINGHGLLFYCDLLYLYMF